MQTYEAEIRDTRFGFDDHTGNLTYEVYFQRINSEVGCWFGGYSLSGWDPLQGKEAYSEKGLESLARLLKVVGCKTWELLKGTRCRIRLDSLGRIYSVGNLTENVWFSLKDFYEE